MTSIADVLSPTDAFLHLRVHSSFSLAEGAMRLPQIVEMAQKQNMPAVGLTDSGNLFASLEFATTAAKQGIQPLMGVQANLAPVGMSLEQAKEDDTGHFLLFAQDETGYRNLLKLVTDSYLRGSDCHHPVLTFDALQNQTDGLIALSGGTFGILGKRLLAGDTKGFDNAVTALKSLFPNRLYIELNRHGRPEEKTVEPALLSVAYDQDIPLVATNDVMFPEQSMYTAHDALICIADGRYISEEERRRFTPEHYFKTGDEMAEIFADLPEALLNTRIIAQRCAIMPQPHAPMLPRFDTGEGRDEKEELRYITTQGLLERLRDKAALEEDISQEQAAALSEETLREKHAEYFDRMDFELDVIIRMDFPGYFLIVSDFIRWAKRQNIPVGPGRGSGAGSLVAYALKITNLDPLRFGLLFERFLNPERVSMPDFDVDFCQDRREEVIRYVQDKYGADRVAQIITFGKLQARAVVRDVGRVLQMPYSQTDRICKMIPNNPANPVSLGEAIAMDPELQREQKSDEQVEQLLDIGLKLEGLHRHASTHAAGLVIGRDPLVELLPLYTDHRSPIPATQYSMKYAEMAGLVKFDFLGLKTLTTISRACNILEAQGNPLDIEAIPFDDRKSFDMLSAGESTGVFQMESAGMRDALRKMKPDTIEDIIALISLYRPGPMENIPTYIARKHGRAQPDYLHPKLEPCLKETFGVIIYQEQVMEIAKVLAGYSLGGADLLRRAMGKKIKEEMDKQRETFMEGALQNGVDKEVAGGIFDLVAKFAGYGFNKSHAAAYAVIGYQTAYLKANYPVAFLTASMNMDIGDTDKLKIFKEEAIRSNITLLPPDINRSSAYFIVEELSKAQAKESNHHYGIRYGLGALKGVGISAMQCMEQAREHAGGQFDDLFHFARECDGTVLNKRQIESLARAGAFDSINPNRHQVLQSAGLLSRYSQQAAEEKASAQVSLFGTEGSAGLEIPLPQLPDVPDWASKERMEGAFAAIGFYLSEHPLDSQLAIVRRLGAVPIGKLEQHIPISKITTDKRGRERMEGTRILIAGVAESLTIRSSQRGKFAYVQISDPSGSIELSLFNERTLVAQRDMLESRQALLFEVDAQRDEGGIRLQIESLRLLAEAINRQTLKLEVRLHQGAAEQPQNVAKLKTLLSAPTKGESNQPKARVQFLVPTGGEYDVKITLQDTVAYTPELERTLLEIPLVARCKVA